MQAAIDGHIFRASQGLTFTTPQGEIPGSVDIEAHGCGLGVTRFRGVVETLLLITGAPIDDELHRTTIRFIVKELPAGPQATANVARAFVAEIERQYQQVRLTGLETDCPVFFDLAGGAEPFALRWY